MLGGLLLVSALVVNSANPVQSAADYYRDLAAYQVRVKSTSNGKTEMMRYYFKKPGYVRMEMVQPFGGAVLVYDPLKKKVKLWPFGHQSFPSMQLNPDNNLIRSSTGHRIDQSDVGVLLGNVQKLQNQGNAQLIGNELVNERQALHLVIEGNPGISVDHVHRYELWLDLETGFPLKVSSHDLNNKLIENVEMDDLQINPAFASDFFSQ
jgi:outer membrane lipoprotein-sorting protein